MRLLLSLAIVCVAPSLMASAPVCVVDGAPPARPAITGIAFVAFYVDPGPAADHFYGTELGFQPTPGTAGSTLYPVNTQQWIETRPVPATIPRNDRQAAVGFITPDIQAMAKYLVARGYGTVNVVVSAKRCEPVLTNGQFQMEDPEGNLIVFVQAGSMTQIAHSIPSPHAISKRLIHAGFVVQDEAKENAFYRDVLGFRPYWHGGMKDNTSDWVSQQVPEGTDWIEYMLNIKPDASANTRGVMNHVSLGVEKMDTVVAQLKSNGCETQECTASKMGRDGKIQLNLYDPSHTRIEVMEFAPSGTICCSPYTGAMPSAELPGSSVQRR